MMVHPKEQRDSGPAEAGVRAEQVKLLYRQFPPALLATMINAVIVAAALWGHADGRLLLGWLAALSVIYGARYLLLRAYFRSLPANEQATLWGRRFVIGAALGGAVWGAAGLLLFPLQSSLRQILVPFLLAGMCAAGISTLSSWRHAYAAFLLPAVLPFAGRALWQGDTPHIAMGLMAALFVVMMLSISQRHYQTVTESLSLRFRNLDLLEAVRRSEQKLAAHVQRTPLAVIEWDLDFRVMDWNPGAEAVFGFSKARALGRHGLELLVPEYERERVSQVWQRLMGQSDGGHSVNDNLTADGRIITCEWFNTPLVDEQDRVIGVASLARDITERRRAEEALQRARDELEQRVAERTEALTQANRALQEEIAEHKRARQALQELSLQHAMILDSAGEGIFGIARDGRFSFVNQAAARMLGYEVDELMDQPIHALIHHSRPDGSPYLLEDCQCCVTLHRGSVSHVTDEVFWRKDGTSFPVEYLCTPATATDTVLGSVVVFKDITERRRAEQERAAYARRQRDALVREINHRIKNNLQGVIAMLSLQAIQHPQSKEGLDAAIGQLQSVATVYGLQSKDPDARINLADMVAAIAKAVESLGEVSMSLDLSPELTRRLNVEKQEGVPLALVVNELLTNALKHSAVAGARAAIRVGLCGDRECVSLMVRNPGTLPAGFDLARGTGLGTGLSLVRSMLPREGASLSIAEDDGEVIAKLELGAPILVPRPERL